MTANVERKLTTILCADVAGYSRLMGKDEVGTLNGLRRRLAVFKGLIEQHRGRLVNTWGDGLIAEFPSVVEAVRTAIEAQKELRVANDQTPDEILLEFRIGINLGDVIVEGQDLYGEGVNVAARLQTLAEPGGIVISGSVHDQVRGKLSVGFAFAGPQQLKNIPDPVPAYRIVAEGTGGSKPTAFAAADLTVPAVPSRWRGLRSGLVTIVFLFLLNLFTGLEHPWFQWPALVIGFVMALRWARLY